jgi:hypothetical protein
MAGESGNKQHDVLGYVLNAKQLFDSYF